MRSKPRQTQETWHSRAIHVLTDAVRCDAGWRARMIYWPASGLPEIYECPSIDKTEDLALQRAHILAGLRYPEPRTLH
jgi:hypothetical protein